MKFQTSVDSLKVRIPISEVKILDQNVLAYWAEMNMENGEVDEATYKLRAKAIETKSGVKTKYLIQRGTATTEDSLAILFNSKILGEKYFEGIHKGNIKEVYGSLIAQNVATFSHESFLGGLCTDVDIKRDVILVGGFKRQVAAISQLKELTKATPLNRGGYHAFCRKENCGIQWSKRELATASHPHLKVYAKDVELLHNSNEFYHEFIKSVPKGLTRIEGTIKNKRHFQSTYKLDEEFSLLNLLAINSETHNLAIKIMASKHLDINNSRSSEKDESAWGISDAFCAAFLDSQKTERVSKHIIASYTKNKKQTHDARRKIETIWKDKFSGTNKGKKAADLDQLFGALGLGD